MSRLPDGLTKDDQPQLKIVAREVLLDSLEALVNQADALTIIGAQAVYLRSGAIDLTVASYTSDADFSVDPLHLAHPPTIDAAMRAAGFEPKLNRPGQWYTSRRINSTVANIGVDLLVPESVGRPGRRAAGVLPHAKEALGQAAGLEAALLDADVMEVTSLLPADDDGYRVASARVAGPAALLVAKAYKIHERNATKTNLDNKDAGDVVRLMMATDPVDVAARFHRLMANERTQKVAAVGLTKLRKLFGGARTDGTQMAIAALAGDPIEDQIADITTAYLEALPESGEG